MKTNYEIRYAAHPEDAKEYDTKRIRRDFLIEKVFAADEVNMVYSMYDRMVVGGAMPVNESLKLEAIDPLKAPFFTTRREVGVFNVGGAGCIKVGGETFELDDNDITLGRDPKNSVFLNDMTVSRKHAHIDLSALASGYATIEDLGSLNGTWVDGAIVNKAVLKDGSTIQIGTFRMVFHTNRRTMRVETG